MKRPRLKRCEEQFEREERGNLALALTFYGGEDLTGTQLFSQRKVEDHELLDTPEIDCLLGNTTCL